MNLHARYPTTPEEFLRWNEGREGKREFVGGKVVEMMNNVTKDHWRLANRLARQLAAQLGEEQYDIGAADYGVRTGRNVRFPDVLVDSPAAGGKSLATNAPVLLAEILSKSSMADDLGQKARDYLELPALQHYLVLSQDEMRIWIWSREPSGAWGQPKIVEAGPLQIAIDGHEVTVDLQTLYAGIAGTQSAR